SASLVGTLDTSGPDVPGTRTWMPLVERPTARRLPTARSAEALSTKMPTIGVIGSSPLYRRCLRRRWIATSRDTHPTTSKVPAITATTSQLVSLIAVDAASGRSARPGLRPPPARRRVTPARHGALEKLDEVDDLALLAFRPGRRGSLLDVAPFGPLVDERQDLAAIFVLILRRVPRVGHVADELLRDPELLLADAEGLQGEGLRVSKLRRIAQEDQHQDGSVGADRGQVLPGPHHHGRDRDPPASSERLAQERVALLVLGGRRQVVRVIVVHRVDVLRVGERQDVDPLRALRAFPPQILVADDHVATLRMLEPSRDPIGRHLFACPLVDLAIADRGHVLLVEQRE